MKNILLPAALCALAVGTMAAASVSDGGEPAKKPAFEVYEFPYGDTVRTYSMYIPDSLAPGRPLVVCAHGYGSKTRRRKDLNKAADKYGYAICYPDGAPDSRGKAGWNVHYPSQHTMKVNEADFFEAFVPVVVERFGLNGENIFLAGMSNGGDLCYQLAYERPELFKAYASVAGLTFDCIYDSLRLTKPVPFMEIHGNHDTTSAWQGDHANKGGWGAYIPTPLAVSAIAVNNRCHTMVCDTLQSLTGDPGRPIYHTLYTDSPYGANVEVYEVQGGKHSWHAKDLPTADLILRFFTPYIKP